MALDESYRDYFIRNLHDALSGHTSSSVEEAVKSVNSLPILSSVFTCKYIILYMWCTYKMLARGTVLNVGDYIHGIFPSCTLKYNYMLSF